MTTRKWFSSEELLRYANHPLRNCNHFCPRCKSQVVVPAYPGDYFDCVNCDWSKAPTKRQVDLMANRTPMAIK